MVPFYLIANRLHLIDTLKGGLIITRHHYFLTQFTQVLKEIVSEAVIVIN